MACAAGLGGGVALATQMAMAHTADRPPEPAPAFDSTHADPAVCRAPYRLFNIGNNQPVQLMDLIAAIERHTGKVAQKQLMDIQPGDVPATFADVSELAGWTGFHPAASIDDGVGRFIAWYRDYYRA